MDTNQKKYKIFLKQLGIFAAVIFLGTLLDAIAHSMSPEFHVPFYYFRNKVIYGTLWAFIGFRLFRHYLKTPFQQALGVSAFVAVILQTKYYLEGYDLFFIFFFMGIHFIVFFVPAYFAFKKYPQIFSH